MADREKDRWGNSPGDFGYEDEETEAEMDRVWGTGGGWSGRNNDDDQSDSDNSSSDYVDYGYSDGWSTGWED